MYAGPWWTGAWGSRPTDIASERITCFHYGVYELVVCRARESS